MLSRNSTVNRVANSSESPYRSSPESQVVSQPHHNFAATSAFYSNRESSSPTPSTITPSAPSSVASHTPPHSSASPSSHDVPAYIRSGPQQFHHSQAPYLQSPEPQFSTMNPSNPRYHPAESQASHAAPQPISGTSNVPPPSSPQLHPTHPSTKSLNSIESSSPSRIKVRSLSHIQSFASEEFLNQAQESRKTVDGRPAESPRQYEISSMPVADIIEMVAGLLTKITTTNDMQHEHIHRHIPPPDGTANLSAQASSVLAFHGKNVPSITILNYLARIHKYCPTTYEVFLSLLVYFDRMTEMVNNRPVHYRRSQLDSTPSRSQPSPAVSHGHSRSSYPSLATPPSSSDITAQDLKSQGNPTPSSLQLDEENEDGFANFFVVDSFNIHRLVIAGVTCASKFFSDVFYTNSRYAKVGGLPLVELNHLELQFLLLNEFRLAVPVEELEAYGTMLVEFYAREVISQQQQQQQLAFQSRIPHAIEHPRHEPERRHQRRDGSSPRRT